MTRIQEQIDKSISLLYDYADKYDTSVQTIERLARLLRLETFVDKHAHSVNSSINNLPYQRLTIAGSLILLDVDFLEDSKILRVSLSLANHTSDENDGETEFASMISGMQPSKSGSRLDSSNAKDIENQMLAKTCTVESVLVGNEAEMINIVNVNFTKNDLSFLNSSLGTILYHNLELHKLGHFPRNLKHLSRMDTLSHGNVDLFLYFDNIVLILYLIYAIEMQAYQKLSPGERELQLFKHGFINSVGRAYLNSANELGIFVDFWKDFRFINYEIDTMIPKQVSAIGHSYTYSLEVRESSSKQNINYLSNLKDEIWKLLNQTYQFSYDGDSYLTNANNGNATVSIPSNRRNESWNLWIAFNIPVPVPAYLLEYLGFEDYETDETSNEKLSLNGKYSYTDGRNFEFVSNLPDNSVPFISAIRLNALSDLNTLVPIMRNTLVLRNIIDNFKLHLTEDLALENTPGAIADSNGNEFSPEYKAKLKQSLKLSTHVTDEELMALNALTGKKQDTLALDSFMRDYEENENGSGSDPLAMDVDDDVEVDVGLQDANETGIETQGRTNSVSTIYFLIDYIDLTNTNDISLMVYGDIGNELKLKISNGEIQKVTDGVTDDKLTKFVAILNLTENLHKALRLYL